MGVIFHTPKPPMVRNWPTANSMKNIGIPPRITVRTYGTRKAPIGEKHFFSIAIQPSLQIYTFSTGFFVHFANIIDYYGMV